MAKRRRGERATPMHVANDLSLRLALTSLVLRSPPVLRPPVELLEVEDRRTFHPLGGFRPARSLGPRSDARVQVRRFRPFRYSDVFQFAVPDRVAVCVRRRERREVLHAKRSLGRGAGRRNYWSGISCRR